jgi:hypothetical protein
MQSSTANGTPATIMENTQITVKTDGKEITLTQHWDADAGDWLETFRTIMFHLGFYIDTIREYMPTEDELDDQAELSDETDTYPD